MLIIILFGNLFLLIATNATSLEEESRLKDAVRNMYARIDIRPVSIYTSNKFQWNIYLVDSYLGGPSIIIGNQIFNIMTQGELELVIFSCLYRIKKGEARFRTIANLIFTLFCWPTMIKYNSKVRLINYLIIFINYIYYPIYFLKAVIFRSRDEIRLLECEMVKVYGHKKELASIFFRISLLEKEEVNGIVGNLIENLSITGGDDSWSLSSLVYGKTELVDGLKNP